MLSAGTFSSADETMSLVSNKMLDNDSVDGLSEKGKNSETSVKILPGDICFSAGDKV